jgi:transcriptional regulator with XRE-family HTH domain
MADYLDVSRNTVSAWINGHTPPNTQTKRLWALRTGFPYDWIRGDESPPDDGCSVSEKEAERPGNVSRKTAGRGKSKPVGEEFAASRPAEAA